MKNLKINHALIIDPSDHSKFLYPDKNGDIYFHEEQPVFLSCGTDGNYFELMKGLAFATFNCLCDKTFHIGDLSYNFEHLNCISHPETTIKFGEGKIGKTNMINIGFKVDDNPRKFVNLMDVYVRKSGLPVFVKSMISKSHAGRQETPVGKPYYQKSCRLQKPLTLTTFLGEKIQEESLMTQLISDVPSENHENKYLRPGTDYIFRRQQLTPYNSMVYSAAAIATYTEYNNAVQWQVISLHNWKCIQDHASRLARYHKEDLVVFTGTAQQLKMIDEDNNGSRTPIYLYAKRTARGSIDKRYVVPQYMWKMIIKPSTKSGVVYVTVNNPYIESEEAYHICSRPYTWFANELMPENWNPHYPNYGYSYMCLVDDFVATNGLPYDQPIVNDVKDLLSIPACCEYRGDDCFC